MPVRVALHPRHGRNRLYVVTGSDCSILVKQDNLRSLQSRECLAYHLLGETAFTQPPIFSVPELHLTAFRLDADCVTLEDLARTNLRLTLRLLEELAVHALALYDLEPVPALPPHRTMIDYPLPWLDQVQDTSASFRSLLIEAQKRDLLKRCVYEGPSQLHFSHGDLKLDNILLSEGRPRLIDFECCCTAPLGYDTAGLVGLMLIATMREHFARESDETASDFRPAFAHAASVLRAFDAFVSARKWEPPADPDQDRMLARFLIERALSEAMHRAVFTSSDGIYLDLAVAVLNHGLRNLCRAVA